MYDISELTQDGASESTVRSNAKKRLLANGREPSGLNPPDPCLAAFHKARASSEHTTISKNLTIQTQSEDSPSS